MNQNGEIDKDSGRQRRLQDMTSDYDITADYGDTDDDRDTDDIQYQRTGSGKKYKNLIRPNDGLLAAFFVPIAVMIIIFIQRGIFPFGDESFLRTDMYHQYAPYFSEFQYKLTQGGSLLYSWDVGLGVNFAALYAYYLASPFNWLLILCPKGLIIEFMTYMIVLKIGLSGLSFAYYLKQHSRKPGFGVAFFGIFYALSGYMAAYSWNIMWLDCILLFPMIVLGLELLVRKRKCMLYCITLALSIVSNYYISIMICIFMVLYFLALLILEKRKTLAEYAVNIGQFTVYSLAAGGLSAVVLLPEIFALQSTASGNVSFPKTISSYFSIFDMIARHIGNVQTEIGLDHWPNIYCGVAVLLFFLLFLVSKKIKMKEKIVYCSLLLFFFASFSINILNFIWHGFHYPNSLPARQSFIYIFLMLYICFRGYYYLQNTPWNHIVTAFFASVCFVLLAQKLVVSEAFHFAVFYGALIFLAAYTGLVYLYKKGVNRNVMVLLALALVSVEAAMNTTSTSVTTTSRSAYLSDNKDVRTLTASLTPNPTFFRVEKVSRKTKNDGAWMNFPSVSLFSSTANADLSKFLRQVGCESSTNAYSITGSTPLVDSLLGVKYALYSEIPINNGLLVPLASEGNTYLYENPYTLPLAFVLPKNLEVTWSTDLGNPADVQNDLASKIGAKPVMIPAEGEANGTSFCFTAKESGDYYVYISNKKVDKITATIGEDIKTFNNVNRGYFLELGMVFEGEEVTLENTEGEEHLMAVAYCFQPDGLKSVHGILNQSPLVLTSWTDRSVSGTVNAKKDGLLFTSIPYDKGWKILVDGEEKPANKVFNTFLSVDIKEGSHTIEFKYTPEGLKAGGLITAASGSGLVLAGFLNKKRDRYRYRRY